jgi:hypothetical protein
MVIIIILDGFVWEIGIKIFKVLCLASGPLCKRRTFFCGVTTCSFCLNLKGTFGRHNTNKRKTTTKCTDVLAIILVVICSLFGSLGGARERHKKERYIYRIF